jgi:short-subunit dehydrogenase
MGPVLVTGCSSGIGLSLVQLLLEKDYDVIATARREADLHTLASMGAKSIYLDLDKPASLEAAVNQVKKMTPILYALINNSGFAQPGSVQDLSLELMRAQFQTNVFGTIELTNLCLPLLLHGEPAKLIFLSSILGVVSAPYLGAYCASKYALEALISSLRMELSGSRIHVTSIRPGAIETKFRNRAIQALKRGIAVEGSQSKRQYQKSIHDSENNRNKSKRMDSKKAAEIIISVLEKRKPKTAYYITAPAILMGALRRFIPECWVERIMQNHS